MLASAGNDTFVFGVGATFTGTLDGKGGNDTLNLQRIHLTSLNVMLTSLGNVDGLQWNGQWIIGISLTSTPSSAALARILNGLTRASAVVAVIVIAVISMSARTH